MVLPNRVATCAGGRSTGRARSGLFGEASHLDAAVDPVYGEAGALGCPIVARGLGGVVLISPRISGEGAAMSFR
jgi:hypothetical protein